MNAVETFTAQLRRHARDRTDEIAVVYVEDPDDSTTDRQMTYGQLDNACRALAARLRAYHPVGTRMLLLYPPGLDFVVAFIACQYAGLIAVPAPVPNGQRNRDQRLTSILRDSASSALLTESSARSEVSGWAADVDAAHLPVVLTDLADHRGGDGWIPDGLSGESISFLQYTSGSTASPRGTVVTHANVMAHAGSFLAMLGIDGPVRIGGWLPMHHDMGLIGQLLTPLFVGGTSVMMSSTTFLRRPVSWLRLVDRHGLYMSAAPNFAYDLCIRRITDDQVANLDLSRWVVAINGSEPVQARTVEEFALRFAAAGLRPETICPGYGLAEATLAVSLSSKDRPPVITEVESEHIARHDLRPVVGSVTAGASFVPRLVGTGSVSGIEIRIVDPDTRSVLPDRVVGEIWLRGPSVAQGYWQNPVATAAVFAAVTADGEGGFLRTGDMGVYHDGQLYVTARIKELLIVSGRNLYPQDLEAETRLVHESLAQLAGAAFTVPVPHEEIVVVHECRARRMDAVAAVKVAGDVQLQLSRSFGTTASVVLVRPGAVPRTTSGKIQRTLVRQMFLDQRLEPIVEHLTVQARRLHPRSTADVRLAGTGIYRAGVA